MGVRTSEVIFFSAPNIKFKRVLKGKLREENVVMVNENRPKVRHQNSTGTGAGAAVRRRSTRRKQKVRGEVVLSMYVCTFVRINAGNRVCELPLHPLHLC